MVLKKYKNGKRLVKGFATYGERHVLNWYKTNETQKERKILRKTGTKTNTQTHNKGGQRHRHKHTHSHTRMMAPRNTCTKCAIYMRLSSQVLARKSDSAKINTRTIVEEHFCTLFEKIYLVLGAVPQDFINVLHHSARTVSRTAFAARGIIF